MTEETGSKNDPPDASAETIPSTATDENIEQKDSKATEADDPATDNESKEEPPLLPAKEEEEADNDPTKGPVLTRTGKKRPAYKYDPKKISLRFVFANRDGLAVTMQCDPQQTVGEVKGALLSVWPSDLSDCSGGDRLRLICMGKGMLMPDTRTLEDCEVPVFKTHPTPINVSVRPEEVKASPEKKANRGDNSSNSRNRSGSANNRGGSGTTQQVEQGCSCNIM
mmetsp:Transcript_31507/g.46752  ORF Transcript_31507/g.46752 Transcript_31507/m.46752 type:complete len:224 (-) Transcript_31507:202-873(-)|eukprot:CAMPEP_0194048376 /NCGR_PEP_ID=MMETSP0009_2-20130614/27096_1 /TAXON_ID=210454 /ORGANISM="Grammatophora oceanica, Strain CCMP 410" /LENGTH=223 /DNA_ID=CAMNT_0038694223 /DNA_START=132 /DNA_END=803 /DNA_ORIENTATION=+